MCAAATTGRKPPAPWWHLLGWWRVLLQQQEKQLGTLCPWKETIRESLKASPCCGFNYAEWLPQGSACLCSTQRWTCTTRMMYPSRCTLHVSFPAHPNRCPHHLKYSCLHFFACFQGTCSCRHSLPDSHTLLQIHTWSSLMPYQYQSGPRCTVWQRCFSSAWWVHGAVSWRIHPEQTWWQSKKWWREWVFSLERRRREWKRSGKWL